jgi:succinoglycan biosynthesis protein ExoA
LIQFFASTKMTNKTQCATNECPFVSVIMPIRNEEDFIARSLGAVLAQEYPQDRMEVLAVDGMSTDKTRQIVQQIGQQNPHVSLLDNPQKIAPYALNRGLTAAKGEIIVRVDGHCEIAPDYVHRCVQYLENNEIGGVGGPLETIGGNPMAQTIAAAMSSPFGVGGSPFRTVQDKTLFVDTVAFPAYRRSTLKAAGPFDEELVRNQDDEYNYRLRKLGFKILLAGDVKAKYYSRGSLSSLWWQYFQYGFWKVRVLQKHPGQMQPRQFVPFLFVSALLISLPLSLLSPWGRRLLAVIVGIYSAANLLASLSTAKRHGWQHLTLLPLIYTNLHVGYGLGFLWGLIKFARRWRQ